MFRYIYVLFCLSFYLEKGEFNLEKGEFGLQKFNFLFAERWIHTLSNLYLVSLNFFGYNWLEMSEFTLPKGKFALEKGEFDLEKGEFGLTKALTK